jgi:hypothetical protein
MKNTSMNVLAGKALSLFMLTIVLSACGGRPTIMITNPANGATLRELTSIGGTVTNSTQVEVAIHMQDGDGAWNPTTGTWIPTPGPWLAATVSGNNWSAPAGWQLPSGNTLRNGHYRILAHAVGTPEAEQVAVNITINR